MQPASDVFANRVGRGGGQERRPLRVAFLGRDGVRPVRDTFDRVIGEVVEPVFARTGSFDTDDARLGGGDRNAQQAAVLLAQQGQAHAADRSGPEARRPRPAVLEERQADAGHCGGNDAP